MAGRGWLERAQTVVAPDNRVWTVRRVLFSRPPRWRGESLPKVRRRPEETAEPRGGDGPERKSRRGSWLDALDALEFAGHVGDALPAVGVAILAISAALIALVFAWFVVFPLLFFVVDLLIFLLIVAGGVALRVLFRRPWKIEARTVEPPPEEHTWGVVGLRASGHAIEAVAQAIHLGTPPGQVVLDR